MKSAAKPATKSKRRLPPEGSPLRYVEWIRPKCNVCGSPNFTADHGAEYDPDDGSVSQRVTCECGAKFITVAD